MTEVIGIALAGFVGGILGVAIVISVGWLTEKLTKQEQDDPEIRKRL